MSPIVPSAPLHSTGYMGRDGWNPALRWLGTSSGQVEEVLKVLICRHPGDAGAD